MYMTSLAAELVERQFVHRDDGEGVQMTEPVPKRAPLWHGRAVAADLLARAARSVAPTGYNAAA